MSTFTYHNDSKTVTCICGKEISGEHACYVIQVKECNGENCAICEKKKVEQLFIDQWYEDRDGYSCCSTCGVKSDGVLPKDCCCNAYVDIDGVEKCKSCNRLWSGEKSMLFHDCEDCRFK